MDSSKSIKKKLNRADTRSALVRNSELCFTFSGSWMIRRSLQLLRTSPLQMFWSPANRDLCDVKISTTDLSFIVDHQILNTISFSYENEVLLRSVLAGVPSVELMIF